jgi:hypothetical protein
MNFNYSTIALSIALLTLSTTGFSQTSKDLTFNDRKAIAATAAAEKEVANAEDLNTNAVRDFSRNFKNVSNVKWTKSENGSSVYYQQEGVSGRTTYDAKGKREYTIRYFDEFRLPSDVRSELKSTYQDYTIGLITEVTRKDRQYYVVNVENDAEILTVQVADDGMNIIKKVFKSR